MGRVEGKKAFVTGGAQGLGRASAMMLAKEGALVTLADINEKGAKAVADEINAKYPGKAFSVGLDVTREDQWKAALAHADKAMGGMRICGGINEQIVRRDDPPCQIESVQTIDEATFERLYDALIAYYERHTSEHSAPYPGCLAALDALQALGCRLAVVTNKQERFARYFGKYSRELMFANDKLAVAMSGAGNPAASTNLAKGNYELARKTLGDDDRLVFDVRVKLSDIAVSYDAGHDLTTFAVDVDHDGAVDLTIRAAGDHADYPLDRHHVLVF